MRDSERERQAVRDSVPIHRRNFTIRVSDTEKNEIVARAEEYANGNVSAWVRYACTRLVPNETDMIILTDKKKT